jgi:hypothetical protein
MIIKCAGGPPLVLIHPFEVLIRDAIPLKQLMHEHELKFPINTAALLHMRENRPLLALAAST